MNTSGFCITDPGTGEERFILYSELEQDVIELFIRPVGGFVFPANLYTMKKLPKAPYYVEGWLPKKGKSLLYAPPKNGKSFLCLQLARCIGVGEPFLGLPTTQGTVMYIQFELGEEILQDRLIKGGQDYSNVFVGTTFSMKLDTKAGQNQLTRAMSAVEPQVLILDPKIKMIKGDENESTEMERVCDFLDELIEAFNCSIFVVDHSGKDLSRGNRGSSVWEGWVDSFLQMKKTSKPGEPLRVEIKPISLRHAQLPPQPIKLELGEDFEFHPSAQTVDIKKEEVAKEVKKKKEVSTQDLLNKFPAKSSLYSVLAELIKEGRVEREGRGVYKWIGKKDAPK